MTAQSLDDAVMHWVDGHRVDWITSVTLHMMDVGSTRTGVAAMAAVFVAGVVMLRAWRAGVAAVVGGVVGIVSAEILKGVFDRGRPPAEHVLVQMYDSAMPSSHAALTAGAAVALLVAYRWPTARWRWIAGSTMALVLLAIGAAMVYLGGHWTTDVLAGWALGGMIGVAAGWTYRPARARPEMAQGTMP